MKKIIFLTLITVLVFCDLPAQTFYGSQPLAHTFSILARDPETGEMGVAVQSHWFSVGSIVSWGEAGVGVIATQSFVNPSFGPRGLELLKEGKSPQEALNILISEDEGRNVRQLAILDAKGNSAAYTGTGCIEEAGHINGKNFSTQANLMKKNTVWPAMEKAFNNSEGPLAERMIAALEAAQKEGGDIRGKQSAAILIVRGVPTGKIWKDRLIDLRVADSTEPIKELKRLIKVHRAYDLMNSGDEAVTDGDMELAMQKYKAAEEMFPENDEMKFWHAVTLANIGRVEESLPLFRSAYKANPDWKVLVPRIIKNNLLKVNEGDLNKILSIE